MLSRIYTAKKRPDGQMTSLEWNQFNKDLWAALVHLSAGEAAAKVDHSGQGQGLMAYLRVWNWFNANANVQTYEHRMKVLSADRCKTAATVADTVERWENRLSLIQEGGIPISFVAKVGKRRCSGKSFLQGWTRKWR